MIVIPRLKQLYAYFFKKYDADNDQEIRKVLNDKEYSIFLKMDNYDKLHSFHLYKMVQKDMLLKDDINYIKLALLHDSAKGHTGFYQRLKQVVIKKSKISDHALLAYENLLSIDPEVAKLTKIHHDTTDDVKMKRFQKLDE